MISAPGRHRASGLGRVWRSRVPFAHDQRNPSLCAPLWPLPNHGKHFSAMAMNRSC